MKWMLMALLFGLTSCSMLPFLVSEVEEAIEFEQDAIRDEIQIRNKLTCTDSVWNEVKKIQEEERLRAISEDYYHYHFPGLG